MSTWTLKSWSIESIRCDLLIALHIFVLATFSLKWGSSNISTKRKHTYSVFLGAFRYNSKSFSIVSEQWCISKTCLTVRHPTSFGNDQFGVRSSEKVRWFNWSSVSTFPRHFSVNGRWNVALACFSLKFIYFNDWRIIRQVRNTWTSLVCRGIRNRARVRFSK